MKENIFEGAIWGQKFHTKDNREVVFYEHIVNSHGCDMFVCRVKGEINDSLHNADGTCSYSPNLDIVSRYQKNTSIKTKPIDEDKLEELAWEFSKDEVHPERVYYGFIEGYRKALEN